MSAPGPDRVNVDVLADEAAGLARRYPMAVFRRLAEVVVGSQGDAEAHFAFSRVGDGVPGCDLEVSATVTLTCQRCLEPFEQALRSTTKLVFVGDEEQAGSVPAEFEPVQAGQRVDLRELVEDELLLSLPVVALHGAGTQCAGSARQAGEEEREAPAADTQRPFAKLQELLKH